MDDQNDTKKESVKIMGKLDVMRPEKPCLRFSALKNPASTAGLLVLELPFYDIETNHVFGFQI